MMEVISVTDYLYARPSFIGGMAKVLDLGDTLTMYNASRTPAEADYRATKCDWAVVGKDLRDSVERFAQDYDSQEKA
jgi:hypothetical protein